jgi:hypothetical protein
VEILLPNGKQETLLTSGPLDAGTKESLNEITHLAELQTLNPKS